MTRIGQAQLHFDHCSPLASPAMPLKRAASRRVSNAAALAAAELAPFTWEIPTSLALQQWLQEGTMDCRIVNAEASHCVFFFCWYQPVQSDCRWQRYLWTGHTCL